MTSEVKSYMTGTPITIDSESPALAALDLMIEHDIRHLPVCDHQRRVCGVLSFDDLRAAFPVTIHRGVPPSPEERRSLLDIAVGEVMTYAPVTIAYDAPLEEAAQRMAEGRFGCLPVVDEDGRLDGILSETDLLHALITLLWAERRGVRVEEAHDIASSLESEARYLTEQLAAYGRHEQEITETRRENALDLVEQSSGVEEGWLTERLAEMASRRLRALEHALDRERQGKLGVCERCDGRIPDGRLRALPGTTLCIACALDEERGR